MNIEHSNYWLLDPRKPGRYSYEGFNMSFLYEPFYTGMTNDYERRIDEHIWESENDKGNNPFKNKIIKKIKKEAGKDPYFVITNENLSLKESRELEKFYIKTVRRRDKGLGPLTNLTDGGRRNDRS